MPADSKRSPAAKVMDEAIDLAIEGRSPYPERAAFVDADAPSAGHDIEPAADEGLSVVLVSADGSTRVLKPGLQTHWFNGLPPRVSSRSHQRRNPAPQGAVLSSRRTLARQNVRREEVPALARSGRVPEAAG
jgi:hypothetical protein